MRKTTRCLRCNRKLTDPISVERQYGPVCIEKIKIETEPKTDVLKEFVGTLKTILKEENEEFESETEPVFTNTQKAEYSKPTKKVRKPSPLSEYLTDEGFDPFPSQTARLCHSYSRSQPSDGW